MERMENALEKLKEVQYDMQPMDAMEFTNFISREGNLDYEAALTLAGDMIKSLAATGEPLTRYAAYCLLNDIEGEKFARILPSQENLLKHGPVVIPTAYPITPFPDLNDYEPTDFYDLRIGPSSPINTSKVKNQWFDASPELKKKLIDSRTLPKKFPMLKGNKNYQKMGFINKTRAKTFVDVTHRKLFNVDGKMMAGDFSPRVNTRKE